MVDLSLQILHLVYLLVLDSLDSRTSYLRRRHLLKDEDKQYLDWGPNPNVLSFISEWIIELAAFFLWPAETDLLKIDANTAMCGGGKWLFRRTHLFLCLLHLLLLRGLLPAARNFYTASARRGIYQFAVAGSVRPSPDRPFHIFRAPKSGDRWNLCGTGTSLSSQVVKGLVGIKPIHKKFNWVHQCNKQLNNCPTKFTLILQESACLSVSKSRKSIGVLFFLWESKQIK